MWPFTRKQPKPALFLHIQKTAGSALVDGLRPYYGPGLITHGDFIGHAPGEFRAVPLVSGHFGYDFARPLMPGRYSFTFLRDPVERVISFYHYCRRQETAKFPVYDLAKQFELEPFLHAVNGNEKIRKTVWNNQAWQLARGFGYLAAREEQDPIAGATRHDTSTPEQIQALAIAHLEEFSHVGFAETFEADRRIICAGLGVPVRRLKDSAPPLRAPELGESVRELIADLTRLDQAVYEAAWRRRVPERRP